MIYQNLGKIELSEFSDQINKYIKNFDKNIQLAKGQRRDEDIWLTENTKFFDE